MPAPAPTDIERLLTPIAGDAPAGGSLRHDGTYERIREARREDDASLPQGVWERPLKIADYNVVVAVAAEALEHRSKDLQIAAWLADAWAHLSGVQGLTRGLELCAGLLARFWDGLFPEMDEGGDDESRTRVLAWMDEALARRARLTKLGDERMTFTLADWEQAEVAVGNEGGPTREGLFARLSLVGASSWASVHAELSAALGAAAALESAATARTKSPVTLRNLTGTLQAIQALAVDLLKVTGHQVGGTAVGVSEGGGVTDVQDGQAPAGPATPAGPIASRADAYRRLNEAADYLLRTEPHSPVPYLVKRAISWGNMPLGQLLQEFISGADDLVMAHRLLGMRPREE